MNGSAVATTRPMDARSLAWKITLIGIPLSIALVLFVLRGVQVRQLASRPMANLGNVPAFQLTNQNGETFGSAQLTGKIWIADFVYTECPGPCPMISSRMSELQRPFEKSDVQLVSFTVDPEKDTPAVLRGYAAKLKALPGRWSFLTGPKTAIADLSRNGFKLPMAEGADAGAELVHSTRIVLVDRHSVIRGYYDATAPDSITKLIADTSHLLREQPQ